MENHDTIIIERYVKGGVKMLNRRAMKFFMLTVLVFAFVFLACAAVSGYSSQEGVLISKNKTMASFADDMFPEHILGIPQVFGNYVAIADRGGEALCFDVEAYPVVKEFPQLNFTPAGLATVVFAVDKDKTDIVPKSWRELFSSGLTVGLEGEAVIRRCFLGSCAYGLSGENYDKDTAIKKLRELCKKRLFGYSNFNSDVNILFDFEAVKLIEEGRNFEIAVPSDGTFSFEFGILSRENTFCPDEAVLLKKGFRLLDGRSENAAYPSQESYKSAVKVEDVDRFIRETKDATRDIRRGVLRARLFNSADGRENVFLITAAVLIILFWTAHILYKSPSKELTHWFITVSSQMALWLVISMYKYMQAETCFFNRMLWYSYYIFIMGLPLSLFYMALIMDKPASERRFPKWSIPFPVLYVVLLIVIFTNDFHNLVFKFDLNGDWSNVYSYGFAYYIVFGLCVCEFFLATIMLIVKTKKSPKRFKLVFPIIVTFLIISYNVSYVLNVLHIRQSNLALMFCVLTMLFVEAIMSAGLIPSNTGYRKLFTMSPLEMQLLDKNGERKYFAPDSKPLRSCELDFVLKNPAGTLRSDEDTLLHSSKINGGTVVWKEDISGVNRLHRELHNSIKNMEKANAILQREEEIKRRELNNELKEELFLEMESNIEDKTKELSSRIRNLPEGEGRKQKIAYIPLLRCHIKRLCNIFFVSQERKNMSGTELAVYLDELSEFASYAGIKALVRCSASENIDVEAVKLCYNFYFGALSWSFENKNPTIIGMLKEKDGRFIFDITAFENITADSLSENFLNDAKKYGAELSNFSSDDTCGMRMTFSQNIEGGVEA